METDPAVDRIEAARKRYEALAKPIYQPVRRSLVIDAVLAALTVALSLVVADATGEAAPAIVVAWVGVGIAGLAGWGWLIDPRRRAGFEVVLDHAKRESQAWKARTGTRLPLTVRGAERWLRDNPGLPGRATMLARLGRLDEARAAVLATTPRTPEEDLHNAIFLAQLDVYDRFRPDTTSLHERWRALPETAARDFRRGCLATLDAAMAVDRRGDPWPVMASARPEIKVLLASSRASRYLATVIALHVGVALMASSFAVLAVGS